MDERPDNSEQLMDILLVMDQEKKDHPSRGAEEGGELQTKNPLEDNNDLLRVDRQICSPTSFPIFGTS